MAVPAQHENNQHQPTFKTVFQAESYLEQQGYHCKNGKWIHPEKPIVSVDPTDNGVQIQPIQH